MKIQTILITTMTLLLSSAMNAYSFFFFMILPIVKTKDVETDTLIIKAYLKNGTVLSGYSLIYYPEELGDENDKKFNHALVRINERKIRPFETDSIIVNNLTGIPHDSIWTFKIHSGKLTVLSKDPSRYPEMFHMISKNDSSFVPFTINTLNTYLSDYTTALLFAIKINNTNGNINHAIEEYNNPKLQYKREIDSLYALFNQKKNYSNAQKDLILNKLIKTFKLAQSANQFDSLLAIAEKRKTPQNKKLEIYEQIILLDSTNCKAHYGLGKIAFEKRQIEECNSHLTQCLRYSNIDDLNEEAREMMSDLNLKPIY